MSAAAATGSCMVLQMAARPPAPRTRSPGPQSCRGPARASELSMPLLGPPRCPDRSCVLSWV